MSDTTILTIAGAIFAGLVLMIGLYYGAIGLAVFGTVVWMAWKL